jgi:organic radical activating enzyme
MLNLPYLEFYITHVCNLNCENCNRCNNFNFSGHASWSRDQDRIQQWSQLLELDEIGILGGEPLLHPEFPQWLTGLADLWPHSRIKVITNGTQWHRWPQLYDMLVGYRGRVWLDVNCHNRIDYHRTVTAVAQLLHEPTITLQSPPDFDQAWHREYQCIRDPAWPDCDVARDFEKLPAWIQAECRDQHGIDPDSLARQLGQTLLQDINGIQAQVRLSDQFHVSTVKYDAQTNSVSLHRSDPDRAIAACDFKTCPHIIGGRLYKCGPVGILPDFMQQFDIDLPQDQLELITQYQPAEPHWTSQQLGDFVQDLRQARAIPQCSLCPEDPVTHRFQATTKKIQLHRQRKTRPGAGPNTV